MEYLKCFIVGDRGIGKTKLITKYLENKLFTQSPLHGQYRTEIIIDGKSEPLELWDVGKEESHYELKMLPYEELNVLIMCFSLVDRTSFDQVWNVWYSEVCKHYPSTPIILVGTMSDMRNDTLGKALRKYNLHPVSRQEGLLMASRIKAKIYLECSSLTGIGIEAIFNNAVRSALDAKEKLLLLTEAETINK